MLKPGCGAVAGLVMLLVATGMADVVDSVASFETAEDDLIVQPGAGDPGLTVSIVTGGVGGAPAATDGERLLRVSFVNEDGRIEFGIGWFQTRYDLAGFDELYMDVYVATAAALPGVVGVESANWDPPSAWEPALAPPTQVGTWETVRIDLRGRTQTNLSVIWALVFDQLAGATGHFYVDHIRLVQDGPTEIPTEVAANAYADRNEVTWRGVEDALLAGYHVYGADAPEGPFQQLTPAPTFERFFVEYGPFLGARYYRVSAVGNSGESPLSPAAEAEYNGLTDEDLLDIIQSTTFRYFWELGRPNSGLPGPTWGANTVAIGGGGMALQAMVVGAERGYQPRGAVAGRVLQMLTWLEDTAWRYHGVWAHWMFDDTGAPRPIHGCDDVADLIETAYVAQGLLVVRQYFDGNDPAETEIRTRATRLWEEIEWDTFERQPGSGILYWHDSPTPGCEQDLPVRGYHEAMIVYLLAVASPTHPMPASAYHSGWAGRPQYVNGNSYYGIELEVGKPLGGPLFFTHYTHMTFDPRFKSDAYTNYFRNSRAFSLIHREYAIDNPMGWEGYNRWGWGLTASATPDGYNANSPTDDTGTIAPTAALSAMPYTPQESLETLRYFFDTYGSELGDFWGFYDAFNPTRDWFADHYIPIDQGPILVMIENYRTGLCWRLFMQNPEIRPMMDAIGFVYAPDLNNDGLLTGADGALLLEMELLGGPARVSPGDPEAATACDQDADGDLDQADLAALQVLLSN